MPEKFYMIEEDSKKDKYLTFLLEKELYGIEVENVSEIICMQAITEIPQLPLFVKGIVNLRGRIIPVIDMRLKLKKPEQQYTERTCIIVLDVMEIILGLIVDKVLDVEKIPGDNIDTLSPSATFFNNEYIRGIGRTENKACLILDSQRLVSYEEIESLRNIE